MRDRPTTRATPTGRQRLTLGLALNAHGSMAGGLDTAVRSEVPLRELDAHDLRGGFDPQRSTRGVWAFPDCALDVLPTDAGTGEMTLDFTLRAGMLPSRSMTIR
jgi:hypothetical protein